MSGPVLISVSATTADGHRLRTVVCYKTLGINKTQSSRCCFASMLQCFLLALDDGALARVMIAATAAGRSLPKGQHLLLVGRVAVRLNETAGPAG
jgi:hypothetical protein